MKFIKINLRNRGEIILGNPKILAPKVREACSLMTTVAEKRAQGRGDIDNEYFWQLARGANAREKNNKVLSEK